MFYSFFFFSFFFRNYVLIHITGSLDIFKSHMDPPFYFLHFYGVFFKSLFLKVQNLIKVSYHIVPNL